ncbi:MAG: glycosyltransferase [bacterium]|nr:glycosyltransferase [bacterium]
MRIAIVHDWFVGGGAERVVYELHKMYPKAPIYTSYCSPQWCERLSGTQVITSYMQHWPFSKLRKFLSPLRAVWFSHLNLDGYDLVISSSGAEAKFIKVRTGATHITYCHAPTHYYWSRYEDYLKQPGFGWLNPLARLGLRILSGPMRRWDYKAAQRPDYFIANSNYTKEQIKKYYGREATIIHPPVETERFQQAISYKLGAKSSRRGFVVAGRQTPYKKIGLAVKAATKLNVPLVVIGRGPEHAKLKRIAGRNITFLTNVSDEEMPEKFAQAEAFIFPGIDDFGIVAVEAIAAGTPVIAYNAGGALDYVNKTTGLFFKEQTTDSLAKAMEEFSRLSFNHSRIAEQAEKFTAKEFRQNISNFINKLAQ